MCAKADKSKDFKNIIKFAPTEIPLKFLILGDYGVGKTSIIRRYTEGKFTPNYRITVGAEFALKRINWNSNTRINLQLWDIAGHERFGYITRVYYKYSVAAAIVFDLSRMETYDSVEKWLSDLRSKISLPNGNALPVILLANKHDVAASNISPDKIQSLCKRLNIATWFMTSAKENSNIEEAMLFLIHKAMENRNTDINDTNENILLEENKPPKRNSFFCCG